MGTATCTVCSAPSTPTSPATPLSSLTCATCTAVVYCSPTCKLKAALYLTILPRFNIKITMSFSYSVSTHIDAKCGNIKTQRNQC